MRKTIINPTGHNTAIPESLPPSTLLVPDVGDLRGVSVHQLIALAMCMLTRRRGERGRLGGVRWPFNFVKYTTALFGDQ